MPSTSTRARTPSAKQERRAQILNAARVLYAERPLADITMSTVASRAGVAKGTLYLYFDTKEALFLALMTERYLAWFDTVDAALDSSAPLGLGAIVQLVTDALVADEAFVRLIAHLHTVLEQNVDRATALAFKRTLLACTTTTGAHLERHLSFLDPGDGAALLLRAHLLAIGAQHMAAPAPVVRDLLDTEPDLAVFRVDFPTLFSTTLRLLLRGWAASS